MPYLIPGSDVYGGLDPASEITVPTGRWLFARIRGAGVSVWHNETGATTLQSNGVVGPSILAVGPHTSDAGSVQSFSTAGLFSYDFEALGFSIGSPDGDDIALAASTSMVFGSIGPITIGPTTFPGEGTLFNDYNDGNNLENADGGQLFMMKFSDSAGDLYIVIAAGVSNVVTSDKPLPSAPGWSLAMNGALIKVFTVLVPTGSSAPGGAGACPATCQTNLSDSSPPAPEGVNVRWQHSDPYLDPNNPQETIRNVSAYVPKATAADYGVVLLGVAETPEIEVNGIPVSDDFVVFVNQSFSVNSTQLWP